MNWCHETVNMGMQLGTAGTWTRGVLEHYVEGGEVQGRQEACSCPRSEQTIHEISGLVVDSPHVFKK